MNNPYSEYPQMAPNETFAFSCKKCGACCKDVRNAVMVESMDLYRIAQHLHMDMAEVANHYLTAANVAWGAPILLMQTTEPEGACVFLKDNQCSIQSSKPRACRLYPLSVGPDDTMKKFLIFKVSDKNHHFQKGRWYRAQQWVDANFGAVNRSYIKMEYRDMKECGAIMRRISRNREDDVVRLMLQWRYFQYDMEEAFVIQYIYNMKMLKQELEKLANREDTR